MPQNVEDDAELSFAGQGVIFVDIPPDWHYGFTVRKAKGFEGISYF
jgi:hypothetical protein